MAGQATRRVSEWLAATLEMSCRVTGCGFDSRALRSVECCPGHTLKRREFGHRWLRRGIPSLVSAEVTTEFVALDVNRKLALIDQWWGTATSK